MAFTLRPYQAEAVQAVFTYWSDKRTKGEQAQNVVIELPTGTGKSLVLCEIAKRLMAEWPQTRVLVLSHVKELISQSHATFEKMCPEIPAGIYSAGLKRKDTDERIVFGNIQSIANKPEAVGVRHLVLIDEVQLVSTQETTQYQKVLKALKDLFPTAQVLGLTATPYRMDSGKIYGKKGALFSDIVYRYSVAQAIKDGWLSPIKSIAPGQGSINTQLVGRKGRNADFKENELEIAALAGDAVEQSVSSIRARTVNHRPAIVFCCTVRHAEKVVEELIRQGEHAELIDATTPNDVRDDLVRRFKAGEIPFLVGIMVLAVGFDAPNIRAVCVLRPTMSAGLFVQIVGRGTRLAPSIAHAVNAQSDPKARRAMISQSEKTECIVLDYGGNLKRHGPIDLIDGFKAEPEITLHQCVTCDCESDVRDWVQQNGACPVCHTKTCGACYHASDVENWDGLASEFCPRCGSKLCTACFESSPEAEWKKVDGCPSCTPTEPGLGPVRQIRHENDADTESALLSTDHEQGPLDKFRPVVRWRCEVNVWSVRTDKPPTLKVIYTVLQNGKEKKIPVSVCFSHPPGNYARHRALKWWRMHTISPRPEAPRDVYEAQARFEELIQPSHIWFERNSKGFVDLKEIHMIDPVSNAMSFLKEGREYDRIN